MPSLVWRREGESLPDGSSSLPADQLIFSRASPSLSGTYICQGGAVSQSVTVQVLHPPMVTLDQSYHHRHLDGAKLELVCIVEAVPPASVEWWRSGVSVGSLGEVGGRMSVEYRKPGRHVLTLDSPVQADLGLYSCSANNSEGRMQVDLDLTDYSLTHSFTNVTGNTSLTVNKRNFEDEKKNEMEENKEKNENNRLIKHIVHKINKFDKLSHDLVSVIKEENRVLHQILRNQRKLQENKTQSNSEKWRYF